MSEQTGEEPEITVWHSWEMTYRPFPGLLKEKGFDYFLDTIAEVIHDQDHEVMQRIKSLFGDVHLSGHFDREILFSVDEPVSLYEVTPFQMPSERLKEIFQEMVAGLLKRLGLEGCLDAVQRTTTIMRDEGDDDQ